VHRFEALSLAMQARITNVRLVDHALHLELSDGRRGWFPLGYAPRLDLARPEQLARFELREDGEFLYWPDLDDYLSLAEIERWIFPVPADVHPPHSCDRMVATLREGRVPIGYDDRLREFSLPVVGSGASDTIDFCPFCGGALPASLRAKWFDELSQHGLEPDDELPARLSDGTWWRERGL
jgi:hypothetical protein